MKLAIILPILLLSVGSTAHGQATIQRLTVLMSDGCPKGMHSDGLIYETNPPQLDCLPPESQPNPPTTEPPHEAPSPRLSIVIGHNDYEAPMVAPDLPLSLALLFVEL
jgi:hypothetical protein